jgi:AcrR family transcriptional regulator
MTVPTTEADVHTPVARRGRPRAVSLDEIVDASIELIKQVGFAGFTMRGLAERLGIAKMTPYSYIDNKEKLLDLVANSVLAQLRLPEPDPAAWRDQLRDSTLAFRALVTAHPGMATHLGTRWTTGATPAIDWYVELMAGAGFDPATAAGAIATIRAATLADLDELRPDEFEHGWNPQTASRVPARWLSDYITTVAGGPDQTFERALDHILFGLELMLQHRSTPAGAGGATGGGRPRRRP